jgi:hypothetical protein
MLYLKEIREHARLFHPEDESTMILRNSSKFYHTTRRDIRKDEIRIHCRENHKSCGRKLRFEKLHKLHSV